MGMLGDVHSVDTLLKLQGDKVLVHGKHADGRVEEWLLTFIHVVDVDRRELRLVNRETRDRQPDWHVKQTLLDAVKPAEENKAGAKWRVSVKLP